MIALLFCFGGSLFTSLFYVFSKLSQNNLAKREEPVKGCRLLCQPLFVVSILFLWVGSASNVMGISFGNQTLFATTSSFSLIINSFLGSIILRESLSRMDLIGIMIACLGSYLYLSIAKEKDAQYTQEELFAIFLRPAAVIFLLIASAFITFTLTYYKKIVRDL